MFGGRSLRRKTPSMLLPSWCTLFAYLLVCKCLYSNILHEPTVEFTGPGLDRVRHKDYTNGLLDSWMGIIMVQVRDSVW